MYMCNIIMYTSVMGNSKNETENFQRQGSVRKVIPSNPNKENLILENSQLNKLYKKYRQEYVILAEYKMVKSENIGGVYVVPSKESPLVWFGVIFVRNGPYEDGVFRFTIILDETFPDCSDLPKVIFHHDNTHPVIDPNNGELNLTKAFPKWNKDNHLWQVLKYIQWIFQNCESSISHAVNKEMADLFKLNPEIFKIKAQEFVKNSMKHLFEEPPTDDKHYIIFEKYNSETHDKVRASMMHYAEESSGKTGHSWVLPGSFKSLTRPSTPPSDNES